MLFATSKCVRPFVRRLIVCAIFRRFLRYTVSILLRFRIFFIRGGGGTVVEERYHGYLHLLHSTVPWVMVNGQFVDGCYVDLSYFRVFGCVHIVFNFCGLVHPRFLYRNLIN